MKPTAIVTGASRGLGAATARQLAAFGCNVVLNARSETDLQSVTEVIIDSGGQAVAIAADIGESETAQLLVEAALAHFGRIDAVINNAAVLEPVAFIADSDPVAWRRHLEINTFGPFRLIQAALPHLRRSHGRVINVSSGMATYAIAGMSAYCAAKAALNQITAVLALEEPDVTAIAFRPGKVNTAMQTQIREEGGSSLRAEDHTMFVGFFEQGELLPPDRPGLALAVLALNAPAVWSGQFISWNDERVQALVHDRAGYR